MNDTTAQQLDRPLGFFQYADQKLFNTKPKRIALYLWLAGVIITIVALPAHTSQTQSNVLLGASLVLFVPAIFVTFGASRGATKKLRELELEIAKLQGQSELLQQLDKDYVLVEKKDVKPVKKGKSAKANS